MAWTDSLTPADKAELRAVRGAFDPCSGSFDLYVEIAVLMALDGPMPAHALDDAFRGYKAELWRSLAGHFEMRADGCVYLKGARS